MSRKRRRLLAVAVGIQNHRDATDPRRKRRGKAETAQVQQQNRRIRRQQEILGNLVEEYVATGQPVGSKTLVERRSMAVSSSTVRNEFAARLKSLVNGCRTCKLPLVM